MLAAARYKGNDRHYVFQHQQRCLAADALTTILPSLCFNSGTSLGITPESTTTCVQEVISQTDNYTATCSSVGGSGVDFREGTPIINYGRGSSTN